MPFQAFAYRGRRVNVKGRTLEMAGRAERKVVAPLLSPCGAARWEASTIAVRATRHKTTTTRSAFHPRRNGFRGVWAEETCRRQKCGRPNGLEVNPRGQGPRGYGSAARRVPAFEARDAGGVTLRKLR